MVKLCPNCGFENLKHANFCKKCGTRLLEEEHMSNYNPKAAEENQINSNSKSAKEHIDYSNLDNKWPIILITVAICIIIIVVAGGMISNINNGSSLIVDELPTYYEGDRINVHFYDANDTPIQYATIQMTLKNSYGGSTIITNETDANGDCSFPLEVPKGNYELIISADNKHNQRFSKNINIQKSSLSYFNEDFISHYSDYVVRDKDIYVDTSSFESDTLFGQDNAGNDYVWLAGEWFRSDDIHNGNIDIFYGEN